MQPTDTSVAPARFEISQPMTLAGLKEHFTFQTMDEIPLLWQKFVTYIHTLPNTKEEGVAFGVTIDPPSEESGFHYMAAVQVSNPSHLPEGMTTLDIPAHRYAVFPHEGSLDSLCNTIDAIFRAWLPGSGEELAFNPFFLERYGREFNPETRSGDIELWVPVK